MNDHPSSGILYVVATPIGNLDDLSPRAVRVLSEATLILAEDTRTLKILAARFGFTTSAESFHDHNERQKVTRALSLLSEGSSLALVSEAGTPTISDPGFRLVKACHEQGVEVRTVPGPCAAIAALSISGFETDRFRFEGFVPQKSGRRGDALAAALTSDCATIFYESPHRILKTLAWLAEHAPEREIFLGRELTKRYEESLRGPARQLYEMLSARQAIKGEFVLIVRRSEEQGKRGKKGSGRSNRAEAEDTRSEGRSEEEE